ncbi:MAG: diguanylate cyclase [Planctomycetes bacterium]|nr:diguanylate cyclase [Planctomycetota bacterium]
MVAALDHPPTDIETSALRILLVEDDVEDVSIFEHLVGKLPDYRVDLTTTRDFDSARDLLRNRRFDVHFIDYRLGIRSGLDLMSESLREDPCKAFVVVTGVGDEELAARSIQRGAIDYISKDKLNAQQLERCITHCVTEGKQRTEQLRRLAEAHFDGLTGVYRREAYLSLARQLIVAGSSNVQNWAVLHVDVDELAGINSDLGFAEGDNSLRAVAKTLRGGIGPDDLLGRIEDDGFCVLTRVANGNAAKTLAEQLRKLIDDTLEVSVSIGVCVEKAPLAMLNTLLSGASMALHKAKVASGNKVVMYQPN